MNQGPPSTQQVYQLQSSLRIVYQKLNDEKTKNERLKGNIEEIKMKVKAHSLFKQELSSLQKKVKKLTNENKFNKIRLEVRERTGNNSRKNTIGSSKSEEINDFRAQSEVKKKSVSMYRMKKLLHIGRRDSFSVSDSQNSVFEERIKKTRIRIKCKELLGRINLIRRGIMVVKKDLNNFNMKTQTLVENMTYQAMIFSSNVYIPKLVNAQDSPESHIRYLEKKINHWKRKLRKSEWRFAVKQQKMIYQFGMIDFYDSLDQNSRDAGSKKKKIDQPERNQK